MAFDNPIVRSRMPTMAESSRLFPRRESGSAYHNWTHIGRTANQTASLRNNLSMLQSTHKGIGLNNGYQFHPFKIYNVPAPFCVIEPGISVPGNSWRTFSVREGTVDIRSRYGPNSLGMGLSTAYTFSVLGTDGIVSFSGFVGSRNWDYQVEAYSVPFFPFPVQLNGFEETPPQGLPTQFILTDTPNVGTGWIGAAFFLRVRDNPGPNTDVYLAARMFDFDTPAFPNTTPAATPDAFPEVIPLGIVVPTDGERYDPSLPIQNLSCLQIQYNNLTDRFPGTPGPEGFRNFLNYRGNWDDDNLADQYFWPGDVVTVSATITAGGVTLTGTNSYIHKDASFEHNPPPGVNWKALSENTLT